MSAITAIITTYRRPANIAPLVAAIRAQSAPAEAIWAWANEPSEEVGAALARARLDRVVASSDNARFHGRFALALLARTEYVALFDDDSVPGRDWFAHCLQTMQQTPGILGAAGVVLDGPGYARRTMHGWQRPGSETVEVDVPCQAWFLRTEWVRYLFAAPAVNGVNGEDIELAARAWRLGGVRSYCPAHPPDNRARWGSTRGMELGVDAAAASFRPGHLDEREAVVAAELAAGWRPFDGRVAPRGSPGPCGRPRGETLGNGLSGNGLLTGPAGLAAEEGDLRSGLVSGSGDPDTTSDEGRLSLGEGTSFRGAKGDNDGLGRPSYGRHSLQLENCAWPDKLLTRLRGRMRVGDTVTGTAANARHIDCVAALLAGQWNNNATRYFTRRELEKLFYRSGFELTSLIPAGNARLAAWRAAGSPPLVEQGNLCISTAGADEAEEFYTERYEFEARAVAQHDYGLTSIVIVTYHELAMTRACLESMRFVTDEPCEVIVVDNGSTDGTPEYLRAASDVTVIANSENRDFPAAANQGMRAARGRQSVVAQ